MKSFIELLQNQFVNNADKTAIVYHEQNVTYDQLYGKAKNTAALLQQKGVRAGDRVVLYAQDKFSFLVSHLGIILCGGVSLPLNFSFTKDEMTYFNK